MQTVAVYPGSFDPPTFGHLDIVERSATVFSRVIVTVATNPKKDGFFTPAERKAMLLALTKAYPNVEVDVFGGLLVDYVRAKGAHVVLRGLRAVSDFEHEFQMAHMNRKLAPDVDTVFMMTGERFSYISSSVVREIALFGGKIDDLVPPMVRDKVFRKLNEKTNAGRHGKR